MQQTKISLFIILISLPLNYSCKKKSSSQNQNQAFSDQPSLETPKGILIFETEKDLPKCNKDLIGSIVYVSEEKVFFNCEKNSWTKFELESKKEVIIEQNVSDAWRKIWSEFAKSAAYIEGRYSNGSCTLYESGSGFIVGENLLATNGHVVSSAINDSTCGVLKLKELKVWYPVDSKGDTEHTKRGADASVDRVDRSRANSDDTVLLDVATNARKPMTLSTQDEAPDHLNGDGVKKGDEILLLGFSGGSTFLHFVTGRVNAIQKAESTNNGFLQSLVEDGLISAGKTIYEYDLVSGAGASGAAVASLKGEIVGINFAGNTKDADTEFGYAVQIKALRELLSGTRNWQALSPP